MRPNDRATRLYSHPAHRSESTILDHRSAVLRNDLSDRFFGSELVQVSMAFKQSRLTQITKETRIV
jgi:hypothetical protein